MNSFVKTTIDFVDIDVPKELLIIEIPSWQAVAQPLLDYALAQYNYETNQQKSKLTDAMIEKIDIPVETKSELIEYGIEIYKESQRTAHFHYRIMPYILEKYAEYSVIAIDEEERNLYVSEYLKQIQNFAEQKNMSISQYGEEHLHINSDNVNEEFKKRAHEDFIFKIIAQEVYIENGGSFDRLAYDTFIQKQVLHYGIDEIQLREELDFESFKKLIAEFELSEMIQNYFMPQIQFVENPSVDFHYLQ